MSARSTVDVVAEEADQRRAAEERAVADRGDHADPRGGRAAGSSAPALIPTGKPSESPTPQSTAPTKASRRDPPKTNSSSPATAQHGQRPDHGTRPYRSSRPGPNQRPAVIAARKTANAERADRGGGAVAVDQRDADPVVAGALGEREGQHEQRRSAASAAPARPPAALPPARAGRGVGGPASSTSGRKPRTASGTPTPTSTATASRCTVTGTSQGDHRGADQRAGDGADAEAGVEARHDRPAQPAFDHRALHVHRDVPGAVGRSRTRTGRRPPARRRPGSRRRPRPAPTRQQHGHRGDRAAGAEPGDERAGQRQRDHRAGGDGEQHQPELGRGEVAAGRGPAGSARPSWRRRSPSR